MLLEASVTTLSPAEPFAYVLDGSSAASSSREALPAGLGDLAQKMGAQVYTLSPGAAFKRIDINEELKALGAKDVHFDHGDRVPAVTCRSGIKEQKAGFLLIAALAQCGKGYGFSEDSDLHGGIDYVEELVKAALDGDWK